MKIALVVGSTATLVLIGVGLFFLFGRDDTGEVGYVQFPQAGDRTIGEPDGGIEYPDRWEGYTDIIIDGTPQRSGATDQADEPETSTRPTFASNFASWFANLLGGRSGQPSGNVSGGTTGTSVGGSATVPSTPGGTIGTTYYGGSGGTFTGPAPFYEYPGTEGGSGETRDDVEFNPQTGDLYVDGIHFNFTGTTGIPDGSTSDVVGDPDNLAIGSTLGTFIGALIGDPVLGAAIGTAIGSNLFSGYTLADMGITFSNGVPNFGGMNPLEAGGMFDGGDSSIGNQAAGMGAGYFGGYTFALPCTCTMGNFIFYVTSAQSKGSYLVTPASRAYQYYGRIGFFTALGSYTPGTGSGQCKMYVGEDCIEMQITAGTVNALPGYGTSGL